MITTSRTGARPGTRGIRVAMSTAPVCVHATAPLAQALAMMGRNRLRHLIVLDEAGRCAGVLDDRSIVAAWAADPGALDHLRVAAVLPAPAAILGDRATVVDAARLMGDLAVDAVAVVDSRGVPIGIVTGGDLIGLLGER
ncbi:oxidoreductase [Catellatospora sp. TT07R-123]|uniref:CBS domain-containing protein n=1 Tax=Catellatospora sp. TT07R-123 TaxID=2733863 RepID=UPI001B183491|nr:CBS domain-containing protein [Catellatospora sp. TT07R-123]GHJ43901.1 oxidoreductase [Catellatospora sp. TT07R-123]